MPHLKNRFSVSAHKTWQKNNISEDMRKILPWSVSLMTDLTAFLALDLRFVHSNWKLLSSWSESILLHSMCESHVLEPGTDGVKQALNCSEKPKAST